MTEAELAELRALADAATPGPWHYSGIGLVHDDAGRAIAGIPDGRRSRDGLLVASARTAVPRLLDAYERLLTAYRERREHHIELQEQFEWLRAKLAAQQPVIAAARAWRESLTLEQEEFFAGVLSNAVDALDAGGAEHRLDCGAEIVGHHACELIRRQGEGDE